MKQKTFYYTDPLTDDFAGTNIKRKPLPADYQYIPKCWLRRAAAWVLHHIIVTPIAFVYLKIASGQRIVGRKKVHPYRKNGYFIYGNHTRAAGDAFTPTMVAFPRKPYIIVNPDAVSLPFLKRFVEDLGAMPVPDTDSLQLQKRFVRAVQQRAAKGVVAIYPEAHIWPLCTEIRPFTDVSFAYPVRAQKPVFAFTTTYRKRKFWGGVKATVYVDGPFFPDDNLPPQEQKQKLRDQVYEAMCRRSKLSDYSPNRFVPKTEQPEQDEQTIQDEQLSQEQQH